MISPARKHERAYQNGVVHITQQGRSATRLAGKDLGGSCFRLTTCPDRFTPRVKLTCRRIVLQHTQLVTLGEKEQEVLLLSLWKEKTRRQNNTLRRGSRTTQTQTPPHTLQHLQAHLWPKQLEG